MHAGRNILLGAAASVIGLLAAPAASGDDPYDVTAPIVTISKAPKSELRTSKPRKRTRFIFESDDPAATFACRLDKGPYEPCLSPLTVYFTAGGGKQGRRHTFLVRATDLAGNSSGTAVRSLRVARKKPRPAS